MNEQNKYYQNNQITWLLLQRYISEQCSNDERVLVEKWMTMDPTRQSLINDLENIWKMPAERAIQWDSDSSWNRFLDRYGIDQEITTGLKLSDENVSRKIDYISSKPSYFGWYVAAATIILLFSVLGILALNMQYPSYEPVVTLQEIYVPKGQRSTIQLKDGSRVILNAGSTLRIPSDYGNISRTLYLEGEGYFVVDHNPNNPFRVYTGNNYTEVLGTEFNIKAYVNSGDSTVTIYVKKGLVELGNEQVPGSRLAVLNPKQLGSVSNKGSVRITDINDDSEILGWIEGKLVIKEQSLSKIIPQLENRYNISIVVADSSILSKRLTATFESEPLTEILNIISISLQINYERDKDQITLSQFNPSID